MSPTTEIFFYTRDIGKCMIDSDSESFYRTQFLVGRYQEREAPSWNDLKMAAEQTTSVLRDVVEGLVKHYGWVGSKELTLLYQLCQDPSDGLSTAEKRDKIRALDFPQDDKEKIRQNIDDSVGRFGAASQNPAPNGGASIEHPDAKEKLGACLRRITENYESESELVGIAEELVEIDLNGVQSGQLSPILHYLAPTVFPVVDRQSTRSVGLLFGEDISVALTDYIDEREKYVSLREQLDLDTHLRDLSYFFKWVQSPENAWTEALREGVNRSVWQIQPGHGQYSIPDELWPIWQERGIITTNWIGDVDDTSDELSAWTANFVTEMSKGDIVVAKDGVHSLLGLGVIVADEYEYVGGTDEEIPVDRPDKSVEHESIRRVEWTFNRDVTNPIDIGDWDLTKRFAAQWVVGYYNFEELRWNLAKRYPGETVSPLKSLESKSVAYALGKEPAPEPPDNGPIDIPDAPDRANEIERQLTAKNQVVFYGPPGTGKTYTAKQFARWWTGQQDVGGSIEDRIETVTFHPSFTYEDFVEGLSAETNAEGQVTYEIDDGRLKEILRPALRAWVEATETGDEPPRYVLIIDEINRGNLAQIFGELITLLEANKRGTFEVELAHSGDSVTLPPNLYLIGTMNTADQSIALVDTALRRRFRFIDFPPELEIVWSEASVDANNPHEAVTVTEGTTQYEKLLAASALAFGTLNERILHAPDLGKGKRLGHSHLLGHTSSTELVDVWRYDILPQLEEYYFGQFDRLRDELLTETGDLLISWDEEQIKRFTADELYRALCDVAGIDDTSHFNTPSEEERHDG